MSDVDERHMRRALELAERGRGLVEPNPLVGAVLARDGQVVGEGWHQRFGDAHAEVNAIAAAGEAARGATLYVTLEPCCHHGKTPPCTDAVIRAGIVRVVMAMIDPFPRVAGQGILRLVNAGVSIHTGLYDEAARRLNAPYLKLLEKARPYVHAKWAMSLDGKIATRTGDSKWISNEASRRRAHELRGRMDAIVVGIGTALADDPLLTSRPPGPRRATRIVLDREARLPLTGQLVSTAHEVPVIVAVGAAPADRQTALKERGCEILPLPTRADARPDIVALLDELGRRRMTNVLVEGGAEVLGSFLDAGEIDEAHVFLAPCIVGGAAAKSPVAGVGAEKVAEALRLTEWRVEERQGDLYLRGWKGLRPGQEA
jgi:diaminohydroxyphosphoribosylaminopyrimidine deaminase/5-amino-6-(5-phosphoribosylamino)uracil reductase